MHWRIFAAALIGVAVFVMDGVTSFRDALPVLYTTCIVLVATAGSKWHVAVAGLLSALATSFWFVREQWGEGFDSATARFLVSIAAIALTTLLCLVNKVVEGREREAQARFRSIFDTGGLAMWESDWSGSLAVIREAEAQAGEDLEGWLLEHPDWLRRAADAAKLETLNEETTRLFGVYGAASAGRSLAMSYTDSVARALAHVLAGLARGERVVEAEVQTFRATGDPVELVLRVTRSDPGGDRILTLAIDVTARRKAQAKIDAAMAELTHVGRVAMLGQLAASIVHEVNQPLTAAITYGRSGLRWLAREAPDARETSECLERGVASAGRAADVIARVRDLARRRPPESEPVDLEALIEESLKLLRREIQDRGVKVRLSVTRDTPPVRGDRVQIQQVLINLMLNALQAMDGVAADQRELSIAVLRQGETVSVTVRDRGGGIAGLEANRMFEPFVSTKPEGLGIGLSISRSIVEGHGGRIWAANVQDGAEVAFSLPIQPPERDRAA